MTERPDANRGLLYTWRRQIQEGMAEPHLQASVTDVRQMHKAPQPSALQDNCGHAVTGGVVDGGALEGGAIENGSIEGGVVSSVIEIDLPNGVCVRVDNQVDPVALRRVLDALLTR